LSWRGPGEQFNSAEPNVFPENPDLTCVAK
jgi:hypothetical protein